MKISSKLLILILLITFSSCIDDDSSQIIDNTPTTFEIISSSDEHNTLEQLLIQTNLDELLSNEVYTIFAPTDDAFAAIDTDALSDDDLTEILLNHIFVGSAEISNLSNGYISTLATEKITGNQNNINMYVNVDGGITLNGVATITDENINAINGVVHVIDAVITIPNVTTFISSDIRLNTLFEALTRDDQPDFIATLINSENPAPFTVFCPTNDAFTVLLEELELTELAEIDSSQLMQTLNTHVLTSQLLREEDFETGTITTLGDNFELDAALNLITDLNGRDINIIATNIQAGNGVLHIIDVVILAQQ